MQAYNLLFDGSCRDSNSLDCGVVRSKTSSLCGLERNGCNGERNVPIKYLDATI